MKKGVTMHWGKLYYLDKNLADLNSKSFLKASSLKKMKENIKILVIDDEEFPLLENLKRHEFNITHKSDIDCFTDVEPYHIILCDINGVGKFLGSTHGGAYLGTQIKSQYPNKIVISYSANPASLQENQNYTIHVDRSLGKGTSIEDWASTLTEYVKQLCDPVNVWKHTVITMINAGISTARIAEYESQYVKVILSGKEANLNQLIDSCEQSSEIGETIMLDTLRFLASIITYTIKG